MTDASKLLTAARAVVLARAGASADATGVEPNSDSPEPAAIEQALVALAPRGPAAPVAPAASGAADSPAAPEVLRQRASLELKVKTIEAPRDELAQSLRREQADHREALETLKLQQRKLGELQQQRADLLENISQLESNLRKQVNLTEQARLEYEKLKAARRTVGDKATELTEKINALTAENDRLRAELEQTRQERDRRLEDADQAVGAAQQATAAAVLGRLWARMHAELPEVFPETIVPAEKNFEQVCDALVEFIRVCAVLELHVHQLLRDLRQVSDKTDKLNHFYIMLTKNPGLIETLRDFLGSGKRKGVFVNLLRAEQAWARAFASGTYKVIVRSPVTIADEMNYKSWPLKTGFTRSEEAAIGEYYKQTAQKTIPEKVGTLFRKQAAEMAYEDYSDLMKHG